MTVGGCDSQIMLGHVYFDRAFSQTFVRILEAEYDLPVTADKLWEEIYVDHIKELDMVVRPYEDGIIHEFDSLDELREFDPYFLSNVDSEVFDNIVAVLGCDKNDIHDVYPLKQGLTNLSCHFAIGMTNTSIATRAWARNTSLIARQSWWPNRWRKTWALMTRTFSRTRSAVGRFRASSPTPASWTRMTLRRWNAQWKWLVHCMNRP